MKVLSKILLDMIPVLLGVLVAMLISNFNEDRKNRRFRDQALQTIQSEIDSSQVSVLAVLERHIVVIDSLAANASNDRPLVDIIANAGGIQFPVVQHNGLRFFVGNRVDLADMQTITILSGVENGQRILETKFDKLLDFAYATMESTEPADKRRFLTYLSNVADSEITMLELYDEYRGTHLAEDFR